MMPWMPITLLYESSVRYCMAGCKSSIRINNAIHPARNKTNMAVTTYWTPMILWPGSKQK